MKTLDRVCAWALLGFALLHMVASVALMSKSLNLDSTWFFSGGLAIIFGAFLNLLRGYRVDRAITRSSAIANLLLLILAGLFWWVLRHDLRANPQVVVFVVLVVLELLFSIRQWSR
jgi:hypothetical protein